MKRFIFSIVFLYASISAFAQVKIGLQVSPAISSNRVETQSENFNLSNNGARLKFKFGVMMDMPLTDTYYFSSGLLYTTKHVGLKATVTELDASITRTEKYDLQYLQVPLMIKLFTNEITLDTKLFFNMGVAAEITISEKFEKNNPVIEDFRFFDTSLVIGAGVERKVGANTAAFGAITYNRGLVNPISESINIAGDILLKNDLISLDLGIKF